VQALALALLILLGLGQAGLLRPAEPSVRTRRVAGADPISAAASVARESHGGGTSTVVIASVDALADGVVATGLAGALDAPVLLNDAEALAPQVLDVIRELGVEEAVLVGGTGALSEAVEAALVTELDVTVRRIAGLSRYDTAGQAADLVADEAGVGEVGGLPTALLVPAEDVAASLQAGSLAAVPTNPLPVLISQEGGLNDPTVRAIERLGVEQLLVVTSPVAPPPALSGFEGEVRVVEGVTGAADAAVDTRDFRPPRVVVVPAADEARALIAGPLAGREAGVVLTEDVALRWLEGACGTVAELYVVAEPAVVTDRDLVRFEDALEDCPEA
jgi:hypothetical protein